MESRVLQFLTPKSPPSTISIYTSPSTITLQSQVFIPYGRRYPKLNSTTNDSSSNDETSQPVPPTITPPETVQLRFKRRSRRRSRERKEDSTSGAQKLKAQASDSPKKWDDMNFTEKAIELYMGEKGMLFWLNKFAYASIFIVIGGWIVFRFVGPALNLYQLDTPPLAPTSMFKGS